MFNLLQSTAVMILVFKNLILDTFFDTMAKKKHKMGKFSKFAGTEKVTEICLVLLQDKFQAEQD